MQFREAAEKLRRVRAKKAYEAPAGASEGAHGPDEVVEHRVCDLEEGLAPDRWREGYEE